MPRRLWLVLFAWAATVPRRAIAAIVVRLRFITFVFQSFRSGFFVSRSSTNSCGSLNGTLWTQIREHLCGGFGECVDDHDTCKHDGEMIKQIRCCFFTLHFFGNAVE